MAAIWKGSVAFGLVNIPVELRTSVRADHISFRMLHKDDLSTRSAARRPPESLARPRSRD
ncbi:MAG TPA: hypothetical protein VES88_16985 [Gemmatimonadaceae bacterium]|nr:hypothetical protein [Gemmatimonadaceae bacterium]